MAERGERPPSGRRPGRAWAALGLLGTAFVGGVAVALAVLEFVSLRPDHRAPYLVGWGGAAAWWLAQRLRDGRSGPPRPALPAAWPVYGAALAAAGALCAVGWMVDVHVLAAVWATGVYYSVVPPPAAGGPG